MKDAFKFKLDFITRIGLVESETSNGLYSRIMLFDKKILPLEIDTHGNWKFSMKNEPKYMLMISLDRGNCSNFEGVHFHNISDISYTRQKIYVENIGKITLGNFDSLVHHHKDQISSKNNIEREEQYDSDNKQIIQKMIHGYVRFFMQEIHK